MGRLDPAGLSARSARGRSGAGLPRWTRGPGFRFGAPMALLLIMLLGAAVSAQMRDHAAAIEEGWRTAERGALGAAGHAERGLAVARIIAERVEDEIRRDGTGRFRGEGWTDLAGFLRRAPEVSSLWLMDGRGDVVATSISPEAPAANLSERPYFAPLRDGAESYLMPLAWGAVSRVWFFSVNHAVRDGAGRFAGVVQASMHADDFRRAYAGLDLGLGARMGIYRAADLAPLMLWPAPPEGDDRLIVASGPAEAAALAALPAGERAGRIAARAEDGTLLLMAWRRFGEGGSLIAAASLPRAAALASFEERLWRGLGVGLLVSILLGALVAAADAQRRGMRSEARFRGTFEQAAVGMAHAAPDGTWLRVNRRLCDMLGYDEAGLLARGVADVTHPEDVKADREAMRQLLDDGIEGHAARKRFIRADGGVLWVEFTLSLLRDGVSRQAVGFIAVVQDITDRVAAETALAAGEARSRALLESISNAFFAVGPDWRFSYVNRESERVLGLPAGELLGRTLWEVFPGILGSEFEAAYRRVAADREAEGLTAWYPDHARWYEVRVFPSADGGISVFCRDVTDAKEAEAALRASEAQLRRVQRIGRVGGFEIDLLTGVNHRSAEYMGVQGRLGAETWERHQDWVRRLHPDDRERAERRFLDAIADGARDREYAQEYRIVTPSGEVRWIAARAEIERDAEGRATRMLGAHVDVTELKRAEAALAESEARLRTIFETVPVGLVMAELPSGRILGGNAYADALLGHGVVGWQDRWCRDGSRAFHGDGRPVEWREHPLARMAAGEDGPELEVLYERGDGRRAWMRIMGRPVRDAAGRVAGGVVALVDVDQERRAAEALAESETRFRLASDAFQGAIYDHDVVTDRTVRSGAFEDMFGVDPGEIAPSRQAWLERVHPDDRAAFEAVSAAVYGGRADRFEVEYRARHADGRWIHCWQRAMALRDEAGRLLRVIGSVIDVSARSEAELARASSEERLALASVAARIGVWDLDIARETSVVNAQYRALYGLPPGDGRFSTAEWLVRLHPEDRDRAQATARAAIEGGGEYRDEFRILRADTGEERWLATRGRLVEGGGRGQRLIGVNYDVTERRAEAERQLLLAREVDHRAKNVLAVVRSIVKLTRAEDPRRFAEAVEGRVAALARAHTLLARDRWTGAGMSEVIREELAAYAGGGRLVLDGPELRLKPDAVQPLSMVLHELATNAAKYGALSTPGGGLRLTWRLEPAPDGGRIRLRWAERDGPPVLAPPERRGFGSTVVEATVRGQLGGAATFLWEMEGLSCDLSMPAERVLAGPAPGTEEGGSSASSGGAAGDPAAVSLRGRRVMLVEDEPLVALESAATLAELGCEVVGPVATLEEALRLAAAEADRLDVGVLDVNLAGRASFPVADLLARRGVPVVHVTGYGSLPPPREEGGASPLLLNKPLRDGQLALALRRAIAGRETGRAEARRSAIGSG